MALQVGKVLIEKRIDYRPHMHVKLIHISLLDESSVMCFIKRCVFQRCVISKVCFSKGVFLKSVLLSKGVFCRARGGKGLGGLQPPPPHFESLVSPPPPPHFQSSSAGPVLEHTFLTEGVFLIKGVFTEHIFP